MFNKSFGRSLTIGLLLVIIVVLFTIVLNSVAYRERAGSTLAARIIRDITYPVQEAMYNLSWQFHSFLTPLFFGQGLVDENRLLREQVQELTGELNMYTEMEKENERLRELLLLDSQDFDTIGARVIGRNISEWRKTILINKGSSHGLSNDMAVVVANGLVGKIVSTSLYTSEVMLLIDDLSAAGGLIQRSRDLIICEGSFDMDMGLKFKGIDRDTDVVEGDIVVSSGLGEIYPKGIVIGTVESVIKDEYGVSVSGQINTAVDFRRLEEVLVVISTASDDQISIEDYESLNDDFEN